MAADGEDDDLAHFLATFTGKKSLEDFRLRVVFDMEVAGCSTVCKHCWASGTRYGNVPVDVVKRVALDVKSVFEHHGVRFFGIPFHDIVSHDEAAELIAFFVDLNPPPEPGKDRIFEKLLTTGVPVGVRDDWRPLLETAKACGTRALWLAFHGMDEVHDRMVGRPGAFEALKIAIERAHEVGLECIANVFVSKESVHQTRELIRFLKDYDLGELRWEATSYLPTRRSRSYERFRIDIDDVRDYAGDIAKATFGHLQERWSSIDDWTEAGHVERASMAVNDADWAMTPTHDQMSLTCTRDMDVYSGEAGIYGTYYGNLIRDTAGVVITKAVNSFIQGNYVWWDRPGFFFRLDEAPPITELARTVGVPDGKKIYLDRQSMRLRWLDERFPLQRRL